MIVYTFYEPLNKDDANLIKHWRTSWSEYGFEPRVLNSNDILSNDFALEFWDAIGRLPTINNALFDRYCYARWLALKSVGGGLLADYDIINYGVTPEDLTPQSDLDVYTYEFDEEKVWGCVYAAREDLDLFIKEIMENGHTYSILINGRDHVSDMYIGKGFSLCNFRFDVNHIMPYELMNGKVTKEDKLLIHYSNNWKNSYSHLRKTLAIRSFERTYELT